MPAAKRLKPNKHIVLVDTNVLWDKDKKKPVSPEFDAFWAKAVQLIPMELRVPEVVLGELQFQQATSAQKACSAISETIAELAAITESPYSIKFEEAKVRQQVRQKLEKWLKSHDGTIAPTPLATIHWRDIVEAAIWREPPFTFDPKDKDNEKGFRDALILETVVAAVAAGKANETVIFVCNDFLLRTSAEKRLNSQPNFLAFESIPDFESYIELTRQELTTKFVNEIQQHARAKFHQPGDENGLYQREKIGKRILAEFGKELETPPLSNRLLSLLKPSSEENFKKTSERWWATSTRFEKLVGERNFHWISEVVVAQLYEDATGGGIASLVAAPSLPKIQTAKFNVRWNANVKADGRFHDVSLERIEFAGKSTVDATPEALNRWALKPAATTLASTITTEASS